MVASLLQITSHFIIYAVFMSMASLWQGAAADSTAALLASPSPPPSPPPPPPIRTTLIYFTFYGVDINSIDLTTWNDFVQTEIQTFLGPPDSPYHLNKGALLVYQTAAGSVISTVGFTFPGTMSVVASSAITILILANVSTIFNTSSSSYLQSSGVFGVSASNSSSSQLAPSSGIPSTSITLIGAIIGSSLGGFLSMAVFAVFVWRWKATIPDFEGACQLHCKKFMRMQAKDGGDLEVGNEGSLSAGVIDYDVACGLMLTPQEAFLPLESLPDEARAVKHFEGGMPDELRGVNMRLLRVRSLCQWEYLRVYEEVSQDPSSFKDIPYNQVTDDYWRQTIILSWRWATGKPQKKPDPKDKVSPMDGPQFTQLKMSLKMLVECNAGIEWCWIDWSSVIQYDGNPMVEILRSKVYYAKARSMLVLPKFLTFDQAFVSSLTEDDGQKTVFAGVLLLLPSLISSLKAVLHKRDRSSSRMVLQALRSIATDPCSLRLSQHSYFGRVWTLAERMARGGHGDRLCSWMGLECWLGMFLYDILFSISPPDDPDFSRSSSSTLFSKIAGPYAAKLLESLRTPLAMAVHSSSLESVDAAGLESKIADLLEVLTGVWLLPASLKEEPTCEWLRTYLSCEEEHGSYDAWSKDDKVWSIFSFFSWDQKVASSHDIKAAIDNLCVVAGLKTRKDKAKTNDLRAACGLDEIEVQRHRSQLSLSHISGSRVAPDVKRALRAANEEIQKLQEAIKFKDEEICHLKDELRSVNESRVVAFKDGGEEDNHTGLQFDKC